jgi:hypothetical protein
MTTLLRQFQNPIKKQKWLHCWDSFKIQ